ncbi:MAG: hypothetical protein JW982_04805 [Spirochaetes bacterium]|nr:hypothetical protein [Spirochaetota bacterium]
MKTVDIIKFLLLLTTSMVSAAGNDNDEIQKKYDGVRVFQAWSGVENLDHLDYNEQLAKHSLIFHDTYPLNQASWSDEGPAYRGLKTQLGKYSIEKAVRINEILKKLNPDIKLIVSLNYREGNFVPRNKETGKWWENGFFPPDSPYWLRNDSGKKIVGWGEDTNLNGKIDDDDGVLTYLVDFTRPEVQDLIAKQALALKESGLYDGIFFDWMNENATSDDASEEGWNPVLTNEEELEARIKLIRKVREKCGDDFIIMGNTNYNIEKKLAPLLNAVFMECYKESYNKPYSGEELEAIQAAVIFNRKNLASPALVCLEGWRTGGKYNPDRQTRIAERNTSENMKMMRFFTAMSLTLTDGYVLFSDDNSIPFWDHAHNWYDFWDAPIGKPVSSYQKLYNGIKGLYVREFENGWVIYNFSGSNQKIILPQKVKTVSTNEPGIKFTIADRDGEIYIKL